MTTPALLTIGDLLGDRYHIEAALAPDHYLAHDRRLDVPVIVKVAPAAELARMSQEFLALRELAHAGACRVFELGEAVRPAPLVYYTLERLAGESLAARVARAPLTRGEARRLAARIARALAAARVVGLGPGAGGLAPEQVWPGAGGAARLVLSGLELVGAGAPGRPSPRLARLLAPGRRLAWLALAGAAATLAGTALLWARGDGASPPPGFRPAPFVARVAGAGPDAARALVLSGPYDDVVEAVVRDPSGDLLLAGSTASDVFVGGSHLRPAAPGSGLAFVARVAPDGQLRWVRRFAAEQGAQLHALALAGDAVVAAGALGGVLELDGARHQAGGAHDCVIASLDARTGALRWLRTCGSSAVADARALAVDGAGNVYAVGDAQGAFPGRVATGAPREVGPFARSYDAAGRLRWAWSASGQARDLTAQAAVIRAGVLVVGGSLDGTVDLGGRTLTAGAGSMDALLLGLDLGSGELRFAHLLGDRGRDAIYAMAPGAGDEVIVAGELGSTGLLAAADPGLTRLSAFVAAVEPASGRVRWQRRLPARGFASIAALASTEGDRIVAVGSFQLGVELGEVPLDAPDVEDEGFLVELDRDGGVLTHAQLGGPLAQTPHALALGDERLWIAGKFRARLHAGQLTLASAGLHDGFVLDLPETALMRASAPPLR